MQLGYMLAGSHVAFGNQMEVHFVIVHALLIVKVHIIVTNVIVPYLALSSASCASPIARLAIIFMR